MAKRLKYKSGLDFIVRSGTWLQIHIIIEIGHMPLESRSICQDSKSILIETRHSIHHFQNHHPAVRLGDSPMYRTDIMIESNQIYGLELLLQLRHLQLFHINRRGTHGEAPIHR